MARGDSGSPCRARPLRHDQRSRHDSGLERCGPRYGRILRCGFGGDLPRYSHQCGAGRGTGSLRPIDGGLEPSLPWRHSCGFGHRPRHGAVVWRGSGAGRRDGRDAVARGDHCSRVRIAGSCECARHYHQAQGRRSNQLGCGARRDHRPRAGRRLVYEIEAIQQIMMRCCRAECLLAIVVVLTFQGGLRILQNHSFLIATPNNLVEYGAAA